LRSKEKVTPTPSAKTYRIYLHMSEDLIACQPDSTLQSLHEIISRERKKRHKRKTRMPTNRNELKEITDICRGENMIDSS
jgi:hypothetical protein